MRVHYPVRVRTIVRSGQRGEMAPLSLHPSLSLVDLVARSVASHSFVCEKRTRSPFGARSVTVTRAVSDGLQTLHPLVYVRSPSPSFDNRRVPHEMSCRASNQHEFMKYWGDQQGVTIFNHAGFAVILWLSISQEGALRCYTVSFVYC